VSSGTGLGPAWYRFHTMLIFYSTEKLDLDEIQQIYAKQELLIAPQWHDLNLSGRYNRAMTKACKNFFYIYI
jgi:hypothetical protein